jgi:hypothetical protein
VPFLYCYVKTPPAVLDPAEARGQPGMAQFYPAFAVLERVERLRVGRDVKGRSPI